MRARELIHSRQDGIDHDGISVRIAPQRSSEAAESPLNDEGTTDVAIYIFFRGVVYHYVGGLVPVYRQADDQIQRSPTASKSFPRIICCCDADRGAAQNCRPARMGGIQPVVDRNGHHALLRGSAPQARITPAKHFLLQPTARNVNEQLFSLTFRADFGL